MKRLDFIKSIGLILLTALSWPFLKKMPPWPAKAKTTKEAMFYRVINLEKK